MSRGADPGAGAGAGRALERLLVEALVALDAAGETEMACRLAGRACMAVKDGDERAYRRFDALLHGLTKDRPDPGSGAGAG